MSLLFGVCTLILTASRCYKPDRGWVAMFARLIGLPYLATFPDNFNFRQ